MADAPQLQAQLEREQRARQRAYEQVRELQRTVEQLQHEVTRQAYELETARIMLQVYEEDEPVQDLVENNLALREQVQSLKAMVDQVQPEHAASRSGDSHEHNNEPACMASRETAPKPRNGSTRTLEEKLMMSPADLAVSSPDQLITRHEVQQLLASLAAKESQVQLLHQKCASWEQQVIELKFEMQSVKHAAKEQEEVARAAQHSIVRQECCPTCRAKNATGLLKTLKMEKLALSAAISPSAPRTDLEHYKSLAQLRGVFWLQALERAESLNAKLVDERRENVDLRNKMDAMENRHRARAEEVEQLQCDLERAVSCCKLLDEQFASSDDQAKRATAALKLLKLQIEDQATQSRADKRRSARIIMDLRGELNKQLMDLEQLHNASLMFSPKNSRGIDSNRRSFLHVNPAA